MEISVTVNGTAHTHDVEPRTLLVMATPTHLNPLGVKGIGEAGTIGATPAAQSAVIDALAHLGVRHIDMPLTPLRVWEAIEAARSAGGARTEGAK